VADENPSPKTPLERPGVPPVDAPLVWPTRALAVFGAGEEAFARAVRDALAAAGAPASALRVALRHAAGAERSRRDGLETLHCHPSALRDALAAVRPPERELTIGVGAAFAASVRVELSVWLRGDASLASLPAPLRRVAAGATLVVEEPRLDVAEALGRRLAGRGR
jgi:hypothetical protein